MKPHCLVIISGCVLACSPEQSSTTNPIESPESAGPRLATLDAPNQNTSQDAGNCGASPTAGPGAPGAFDGGVADPSTIEPVLIARSDSSEVITQIIAAAPVVVYGGGTPKLNGGGESTFVGFIRSVPVSGGSVQNLWEGGNEVMAMDGAAAGRIAFITYDYPSRQGTLLALDTSSGAAVSISDWFTADGCSSVAATPSAIVWTSQTGATGEMNVSSWDGARTEVDAIGDMCPGRGAILRSSMVWLSGQGIEAVTLGSVPANPPLLPPPARLFDSDGVALATDLDTEQVYVAVGGSVFSTTLSGAGAEPIFTGTSAVIGVAVVASEVFILSSDGTLVAVRPGNPPHLLTSGLAGPMAVAADDADVFVGAQAGVWALARTTSGP